MTLGALYDVRLLTGRTLRHIARSPDTIVTTTVLPIAFMLMFVYVFGGEIHPGAGRYINYLLPGILVITIASSISYTAFRLYMDLQSGILDRFRSMPIAPSALLWAHVLTSVVATAVSLIVVTGVALLMGFRSGAGIGAWLVIVCLLTLFTVGLTWLAVIVGLSARSVDGVSGLSYPLIILPFVSSAFVLTATMPGPVRAFADHQPMTPIINAIRNLYTGGSVSAGVWSALAWCVGLLVCSYGLALVAYRRRLA